MERKAAQQNKNTSEELKQGTQAVNKGHKLYVCRILRENFRQIGQKMKKL